MRRIGTLMGETTSNRFCDYLQTKLIDGKAEACDASTPAEDTPHDIWIRHEKDVVPAQNYLDSFRENPTASEYDVAEEAEKIRREKSEEIARKLKLQENSKVKFPNAGAKLGMGGRMSGPIPVTIGFIVLATVVGFVTNFEDPDMTPGNVGSLAERVFHGLSGEVRSRWEKSGDALESVKNGEVWRLLTPALLHGSPMHLAFNMLNLFILGGVVERIHGSRFYLLLLLVCQAVATLTQVLLPDWLEFPLAIGASGAVFGVFGFVWIRPKVQPGYPVEIPSFNVKLMLGFLVLCMTGLLGGIANGAHVGGMLAGISVAVLAPKE